MNESIVFEFDGATVAQAAMATLTRRGFSVVRSFDLRSALATHSDCECPHHGMAQCTCQLVVLLIYSDPSAEQGVAEPVVLTVHCRDHRTQAQIVHDATTIPDPRLAEQVMAALMETALTLRAQAIPPLAAEMPTDARPHT